jgi:hypothetical protein
MHQIYALQPPPRVTWYVLPLPLPLLQLLLLLLTAAAVTATSSSAVCGLHELVNGIRLLPLPELQRLWSCTTSAPSTPSVALLLLLLLTVCAQVARVG